MSDPAKSADEIEDVLASIRRLVSDSGSGAGARPAAPPGPSSPAAGTPERLVLTPSLRVSEPDDPWAPVPPAEDEVDHDTVAERSGAESEPEEDDPAWGLEDRLSDWGEIEESADEAVADAIAESGFEDAPRFEMPEDVEDATEAEEPFDLAGMAQLDGVIPDDEGGAPFEPETGDLDWPDRGADSALRDLAAARLGQAAPPEPEKPAEEATGAPQAPAEGDTRPDDDPADAAQAEDPHLSQAEPRMTEHHAADPSEDRASDPAPATPVFSRRMGASADAGAAEDADDIEDLGDEPSPFTFPDTEEGILDEETLREIVAEVVRQELQGALGQRITRNVRKMVRREIRIALAAEDLE